MKYENFDLISAKVEQIKKLGNQLNNLTEPDLRVRIESRGGYVYMTIGAGSDSEHPYADEARKIIDTIGKDTFNKINKLKSELEEL